MHFMSRLSIFPPPLHRRLCQGAKKPKCKDFAPPPQKTEHPLFEVRKPRRGRERGWGTGLDSCTAFGRGEENKVKFSNQMAARLLSCSTGICSSKVFYF